MIITSKRRGQILAVATVEKTIIKSSYNPFLSNFHWKLQGTEEKRINDGLQNDVTDCH